MKTVHGYDDSEKVLTWEQWDAATTEQRAGFLAEGYTIKQTREQEARAKRELEMFGCELAAFKASIEQSATFKTAGAPMIAMSMMSDAQEQIARGSSEAARQTLNRAKWILSEYCMKRD
jgi:hypothetical protein